MRHVGDMHAHLPEAVVEFADRERIVEVLRIGRVHREGGYAAEVAALGIVLLGDLSGNGLGGILNIALELVGQVELRQYGMHLGVVVALAAQTLDQHAARAVVALAPLRYAEHHLVAVVDTRAVLAREVYVHGQLARVGMHEHRLTAHLGNTHIPLAAALQHCRDDTLGMPALAGLTLQRHLDTVAVEGVAVFRWLMYMSFSSSSTLT